jgi:hypothetical protein
LGKLEEYPLFDGWRWDIMSQIALATISADGKWRESPFIARLASYERMLPAKPSKLEALFGLGEAAFQYLSERVAFHAIMSAPEAMSAGMRVFLRVRAAVEIVTATGNEAMLERVRTVVQAEYRNRFAVELACWHAIEKIDEAELTDLQWIKPLVDAEWAFLLQNVPEHTWQGEALEKYMRAFAPSDLRETVKGGLDVDVRTRARVAMVLVRAMWPQITDEAQDRRRKGEATAASQKILYALQNMRGSRVIKNDDGQCSLSIGGEALVTTLTPDTAEEYCHAIVAGLSPVGKKQFWPVIRWLHEAGSLGYREARRHGRTPSKIELPAIVGGMKGLYEMIFGKKPTRTEQVSQLRDTMRLLVAFEHPILSQVGIHSRLVSWDEWSGRGRGQAGRLELTLHAGLLPSFRELAARNKNTDYALTQTLAPVPKTYAHGGKQDMQAGEEALWVMLQGLMAKRCRDAARDGGIRLKAGDTSALARQVSKHVGASEPEAKRQRWTADAVQRCVDHWIKEGDLRQDEAGRLALTAEAEWNHIVNAGEQSERRRVAGRASAKARTEGQTRRRKGYKK